MYAFTVFCSFCRSENQLIRSGPLDQLKFIFECRLEEGLSNMTILLRIFLTISINSDIPVQIDKSCPMDDRTGHMG
nr:unnamed protein product [Callosobruchus analis]